MSRASHSYERWERRKCRSKQHFDTIEKARWRQAHAWEHSKLRLQIYACNWCDNFHLASNLRDPAFAAFKIEERKAMKEMKSNAIGLQ